MRYYRWQTLIKLFYRYRQVHQKYVLLFQALSDKKSSKALRIYGISRINRYSISVKMLWSVKGNNLEPLVFKLYYAIPFSSVFEIYLGQWTLRHNKQFKKIFYDCYQFTF